jgi:hypothetical protein
MPYPFNAMGAAMNRLAMGVIAAAALIGGCATVDDYQPRYWETPTPPEGFVTGSKLPRSENMENYRGTKTIGVQDYMQYRREGPRSGDM